MLASKLLSACGGSETLYVDDVFQTVVRTGTGSTATITTGFQPDLVWTKCRNTASTNHALVDSQRGDKTVLQTNTTAAQVGPYGAGQVLNSTGYGISSGGAFDWNYPGYTYVDWVFAKKAKFFDCGTYTGNGVAGRQIPHSLGVAPGMVIVKRTSTTGNWSVLHRSLPDQVQNWLRLNDTIATATNSNYFGAAAGVTAFTVGADADVNASGATYVWYAFAHDTSAEGIIQCGSFTTDGSGNATVNHGWSAGVQFAKIKASSTTGDWEMFDSARSPAWSTDNRLRANLANAEDTVTRLSASGTSISFTGLSASQTYVYVFIVAPT